MKQRSGLSPIMGDVVAAADVTVNTKGGSMTATLKKPLRTRLGELGGSLKGAAVEFTTGQAVILLAGASPVRVRKVGRNRFEIALESKGDEQVDEVTAAFLRLKKDQFEKGKLNLSEPLSATGWRRKSDKELANARALLKKAKAGSKKA